MWKIKIKICTISLDSLKNILLTNLKEIEKLSPLEFSKFTRSYQGTGEVNLAGCYVNIETFTPLEAKIKALREEADRLEREGL